MKKPFYKRGWFLVLMAVIIITALGSNDDDSKKPDPVDLPVVQTQTSVQPIAEIPNTTPIPTPTPTPTPLPITTPVTDNVATESETTYVSEMLRLHDDLSGYMYEFSSLMSEPRVDDEEWIFDTALNITMIIEAANEVKDISVPSKFQSIHDEYINTGLNYLLKAMTLIPTAIDNLDSDSLDEATGYIKQYNEAVVTYTANFKTLMN